jgi:cytochrome c-type biogenesis protein CcmH/NrfG
MNRVRPAVGPAAALLGIAGLVLAHAWATAQPPLANPNGAVLARDAENCRVHSNLGACYDAVRWNPSDPALLVGLGDALEKARRPAEALRAYRRASALEPGLRGIGAKISAAEERLSPKRAAAFPIHAASSKRASNVDPVTQSH